MDSNVERSNISGASGHFIHSLPSSPPQQKQELSPHHQNRHQAAPLSSYNPDRFSQILTSHRFHGVEGYPPLDPFHFSNRHSMGHQIGPNLIRRSYSDNRASWLPPQPSPQTFITKEQKRATLQSHASLVNAKPGSNPNRASRLPEMPKTHANLVNGKPGINPNRASRLPEMPKRPSAEPANLIHSIRDSSLNNRPKSVQVDSRRVVTGILQSALPPSARPPPMEMEPPRSMPIAELEKRHKAALQKLQTHTNQLAAKNSTPSQPKHVNLQQRPTIQVQLESSSEASSKTDRADKPGKTNGKSSSVSSRRSFFGFLNLKEESKSSKAAEEPIKPSKRSPKKKHKDTPKPLSDRGEEEDEDVPLAQLRDRRASYNPAFPIRSIKQSKDLEPLNSNVLTKSYSVPANVNKLGDREKLHMEYDAVDNSRHANLMPGLHQPPTWLHANFDLSEEKHGPRPLIFEDEAKAIRNSKRLWVQ